VHIPSSDQFSELAAVHRIGAALDIPVERLGYLPMAQELVETMYMTATECSAQPSQPG
jgi:hypothetical protein